MTTAQVTTHVPWNHGRIIGPKPPLKPKHIWAIRTRLQHDGRVRDLAMFNVTIDSRLAGCAAATSSSSVCPTFTWATACDCAQP